MILDFSVLVEKRTLQTHVNSNRRSIFLAMLVKLQFLSRMVVRGWGGGSGGYYLSGTEFQFCNRKEPRGRWLHNSVNVLNATVHLKIV